MKLTKKSFGTDPRVYLSPTWISNGHWAITRSAVENMPFFETEASARAFFGRKPHNDHGFFTEKDTDSLFETLLKSDRTAWTVTPFLHDNGAKTARIVVSGTGAISVLELSYCDLLGIVPGSRVYTADPTGQSAFTASELSDTMWILMPFRTAKDVRADLDRLVTAASPIAQTA